jgi:hypothetical protein
MFIVQATAFSASGSATDKKGFKTSMPQTFDDGFTKLATDNYYSKIFEKQYTNPNGCPIRATHFLTHQSTDYSLVINYA